VDLERIRSGDPEALGLFLKETWGPLVRYLLGFLDSVAEAEDAAQEAFVRLWEHRDRWASGSARAVVFRLGRNVALDARRRSEVRRRWWRRRRHEPTPAPATPEDDLADTELRQRFREALEGLPPRRREVFELVRFRGLSYRDVAEVLEISERTVANHLRLAAGDLRRLLSDLPGEAPGPEKRGEERSGDA
jgi:RNA polymerase sigma-70 factor (ECF subfamily)